MRRVSAHNSPATTSLSMAGPMPRKRKMSATQRVPVRKRPRSVIERYLTTIGLIAGIGAAVSGLGYWSFSSGWAGYITAAVGAHFVSATAHAGYALSSLEVEGRKETPKDDIMLALGAMKGDPILDIDLEAARQRIVDLPWITTAVVERRLPGTLRVSLTEAEPLALWQKKGGFYLVSRTGDVLAVKDMTRFSKLPVIVGDAAPQKAGDLFAMLSLEPELEKRVSAAVLVGNRRWNLRLDNGVDIKLPEIAPETAWQKFAALERQQHLLDKDISIIDLRQNDKLVVRQAHPAVAEDKMSDGKKKSTQIKPAAKPVVTPVSAPGAKNNAT